MFEDLSSSQFPPDSEEEWLPYLLYTKKGSTRDLELSTLRLSVLRNLLPMPGWSGVSEQLGTEQQRLREAFVSESSMS